MQSCGIVMVNAFERFIEITEDHWFAINESHYHSKVLSYSFEVAIQKSSTTCDDVYPQSHHYHSWASSKWEAARLKNLRLIKAPV